MPKARPTVVSEAAARVRAAEAELDAARTELEVAIGEAGWAEVQRHQSEGAPPFVIYERDGGGVDELTGMPAGDMQIATLDAFTRGEIS